MGFFVVSKEFSPNEERKESYEEENYIQIEIEFSCKKKDQK